MKKILLIGQGSIAKRLAGHLLDEGVQVFVYQHRSGLEGIKGTERAERLDVDVDGVVIATPTSRHIEYLEHFIGRKPIFVEKPIHLAVDDRLKKILTRAKHSNRLVMVGFQLRFLPIVAWIKEKIDNGALGEILQASLYVGQYLPFWRPQNDYRDSYSAHFERGGGVALDLIHEIDLVCHWFGPLKNLAIVSEKLGDLKVDTENFVKIQTTKAPFIEITLDSLNHNKTRLYIITGEKGSIVTDIYHGHAEFTNSQGDNEKITQADFFDISTSYKTEIHFFLDHLEDKSHKNLNRWLGIDALKIATKGRRHYA